MKMTAAVCFRRSELELLLTMGSAAIQSHPAQYDTDCFWLLSLPHRDFLLLSTELKTHGGLMTTVSATGGYELAIIYDTHSRCWETSRFIGALFVPSKISAGLPKIFPSIYTFTQMIRIHCTLQSENTKAADATELPLLQ